MSFPTSSNRGSSSRRMTALAVLAVLATGVSACDADTSGPAGTPTSAPTRTATPAALPSQDWNRLACHTLPADMLEQLDNLGDTRMAAEHAMKSGNQVIRQRGDELEKAVTARETADLNGDQSAAVDANLDISQAALDMAEACATLYGDGPW